MNRLLVVKLWRDLGGHKTALAALILIIAIGIGCFLGMRGAYHDLDGSRARFYAEQRLPDLVLDMKRAPEWAVESAAGATPNVRELRGRVSQAVLIEMPDRDEPVSGRALSMPAPRRPVLADILLRSGTWFSDGNADEVIVSEPFARANGVLPGHRLTVKLLDTQHDLLVVGTALSPEFVWVTPPDAGFAPDHRRFGVLYMPEEFLQRACDLDGSWNQVVGTAHDPVGVALDNTIDLLSETLDPYGVANGQPMADTQSVRFLSDELAGLTVSSTVMPGIFLGVAALILNVMMGRIVAQQRTAIGTLKAIGYSSFALQVHFMMFGLVIGAGGGLAGIAIGAGLERLMVTVYTEFYQLPGLRANFHADLAGVSMLLSVVFSALGTIKGVRDAAALEPAAAMRPPPPEWHGRALLERFPRLWARLSFRSKMIARSLSRNPYRSTVTIISATISTSLIITTVSLFDAFGFIIDFEFNRVAHQDLSISLREPVGWQAITEAELIPEISQTELQLNVVCELTNGPYSKRVAITGIPPNNALFTPLDARGEPIVVPRAGLVLTRKLAERLSVAPGDALRVRALIGTRREVDAVVAATVDSYWGLGAYANLDYLSRLIGEDRVTNTLLTRVQGGADGGLIYRELHDFPTIVGTSERQRTIDQINQTIGETTGASLFILIMFSGAIAFGAVLNASIVALSEREREVGTLRVLGFTDGEVAGIFAGESLILGAVGIVLGFWGGWWLTGLVSAAYDTELYRFPRVVMPDRVVLAGVVVFAFIVLAQLVVRLMIRRLHWLDVLKIRE